MDVLVVGGTGVAGRAAVAALVARGHAVRALSRSGGSDVSGATGYRGDLSTGVGLTEAVAGVDAVIDASNTTTPSYKAAVAAFVGGTRRLMDAEVAAGVKHHVLVSIVGIDDAPLAYYRAKVQQERAVADGPVPATILRATQFHELAGQITERMRVGPVALIPKMVIRPVAAVEVGAALADAVEAGPVGRAPDLRGPKVENLVDLARRRLAAHHRRAFVVPLPMPGKVGRMMRSGQLGGSDGVLGQMTFDEWARQQ
jgi:uncharacterized protein YbjT (DUF2867 family)